MIQVTDVVHPLHTQVQRDGVIDWRDFRRGVHKTLRISIRVSELRKALARYTLHTTLH